MADSERRLPDGRPILPPPSVPLSQAARQLQVTKEDIRALLQSGDLQATPSGHGVTLTSISSYAKRRARRAKDEREARRDEFRAGMLRDEIQRRRPAKGYGEPKDGMVGKPSSGGLPTLGRR